MCWERGSELLDVDVTVLAFAQWAWTPGDGRIGKPWKMAEKSAHAMFWCWKKSWQFCRLLGGSKFKSYIHPSFDRFKFKSKVFPLWISMVLDGFSMRERETTDSQTHIRANSTKRDEENACCRWVYIHHFVVDWLKFMYVCMSLVLELAN